jgi:hypothetical protein
LDRSNPQQNVRKTPALKPPNSYFGLLRVPLSHSTGVVDN